MVNGYSSIKEGFASTPTSSDAVNDKIADITDEIKDLEEQLKLKKDELLMQVKKQVSKPTKNLNDDEEDIIEEDDTPYMDDEEMPEDGEDMAEDGEDMAEDDTEMDEEDMPEDEYGDFNMDNDIEGFKGNNIKEPFRGSIVIMRGYLHNLLKAILLALLFYLLSSKDMYAMTKQIHTTVKDIISHNILHTFIFLVVAFLVISFVM
jgi:hypothetical protein